MQRRRFGFGGLALSGGCWLIGEIWGDQIFAKIKPMIPDQLLSLENALHFAAIYGPALALAFLGLYFLIWDGRSTDRTAGDANPGVSTVGRDGSVSVVNTGTMHVLGTLTVAGGTPSEATGQATAENSLEIIFDASNPNQRFWSQTPVYDKDGKPTAKFCMEYRVKISNKSNKTVRGVHVEKVGEGQIPSMPVDLPFKKDGANKRDLQPKHSEFVPFFWLHPPQAGDAWGGTANRFFSPLIVSARGDDVMPVSLSFGYYPDQIPSLVEIKKNE